MMKKIAAVCLILMIINLGCLQIIPATNEIEAENDEEFIELTTEIYGLKDIRFHSVQLSKNKVAEIEQVFRLIYKQLDAAESSAEETKILDNVCKKLDQYGLLPADISLEQVQQLIRGKISQHRLLKRIDFSRIQNQKPTRYQLNACCLIAGELQDVTYYTPLNIPSWAIIVLGFLLMSNFFLYGVPFFNQFLFQLGFIGILLSYLNPVLVMRNIRFTDGQGWISTRGLFGLQQYEKFRLINIFGFTGLKIYLEDDDHFYLKILGTSLYTSVITEGY